MIEINIKAKKPDPWEAPALTSYEQIKKAQDDGVRVVLMRTIGHGQWEHYDDLLPNPVKVESYYKPYLLDSASYQIRRLDAFKVMVYKMVLLKHTSLLGVVSGKPVALTGKSKADIDQRIVAYEQLGLLMDKLDSIAGRTHYIQTENLVYV